jgi:hypothetical protein
VCVEEEVGEEVELQAQTLPCLGERRELRDRGTQYLNSGNMVAAQWPWQLPLKPQTWLLPISPQQPLWGKFLMKNYEVTEGRAPSRPSYPLFPGVGVGPVLAQLCVPQPGVLNQQRHEL